ncbi:hypothetical protein QYF61_022121 [Mycteria americana]|uniref:RNase H type-1 domain-containing protein n=1 Tax=Mycteria americana TaxID=33587 RepID=A0AAN7MRU3_MYCAM|nr:hypothetical protein QYF61_022121 [Mycteria americana]
MEAQVHVRLDQTWVLLLPNPVLLCQTTKRHGSMQQTGHPLHVTEPPPSLAQNRAAPQTTPSPGTEMKGTLHRQAKGTERSSCGPEMESAPGDLHPDESGHGCFFKQDFGLQDSQSPGWSKEPQRTSHGQHKSFQSMRTTHLVMQLGEDTGAPTTLQDTKTSSLNPLLHRELNPDLALFVDGSSYYLHGQQWTGYAVVSHGVMPCQRRQPASATNSRYAFGVRHATGMLWKERGFFTSSGKRVSNGEEIRNLLESVQLAREIAVIHCPAHTKDTTDISEGNALADAAVKAAAQQPLKECMVAISMDNQNEWPN